MKAAVLLAGSGVFDGSEIHETVFTLLSLEELGIEAVCFAPNEDQFHVVNHLNGEEMDEKRNVLVESARIARGSVSDLSTCVPEELDGLVIPGGFGAAKNLNQWAVSGPEGPIKPMVKELIVRMMEAGKPIAGLCMGPTVIAKALEGTAFQPTLTVGSDQEPSPYDIAGISAGMESIGMKTEMQGITGIAVDQKLKVVTAPCYMMEASISQVRLNVHQAMVAFKALLP